MAGMSVWTITGNLTRDPELRQTASGTEVCNMGVAVNGWKDGEVDFYDVAVWGRSAAACAQNLSKGSQVAVTGRGKLRTWEKSDGSKGSALQIDARDVTFIGAPRGQGQQQSPPAQPASQTVPTPDDIPF